MVNQVNKIIQNAIVEITKLPFFEKKLEVINTLYDLEWSLREEDNIVDNELAEEVFSDYEQPWSE